MKIREAIDAQTNGHEEEPARKVYQQEDAKTMDFLAKAQAKNGGTPFLSGMLVKGKHQVSIIMTKGKRLSDTLLDKPEHTGSHISIKPDCERQDKKRLSLTFLSDAGKRQASNIKSRGKRISGIFASVPLEKESAESAPGQEARGKRLSLLFSQAKRREPSGASESDEEVDEEELTLLSPRSMSCSSLSSFNKHNAQREYIHQLQQSRLRRGVLRAKEVATRGLGSMRHGHTKDLLSMRRKPGGWIRLDT